MNLDSKTKGQLGMRDCQGMWDRLDRYKVNRCKRPRRQSVRAVATSQASTCEPVTMKTFVADGYTEKAGKHIAKVIQAATRTEAIRLGKVWAERSNVASDRFEVRLAVMG